MKKKLTELAPYIRKYPNLRACLLQVYTDLIHGQRWSDVTIHDLTRANRLAYKGYSADSTDERIIVPCLLEEPLSMDWMSVIFAELQQPSDIYLAITHNDSSVVYYRISEGLVKPPN